MSAYDRTTYWNWHVWGEGEHEGEHYRLVWFEDRWDLERWHVPQQRWVWTNSRGREDIIQTLWPEWWMEHLL